MPEQRSPRLPRLLSLSWLTAATVLSGCGGGESALEAAADTGDRAQALQVTGGTGTTTTAPTWKRVAGENEAFGVPANSTVRYGANGKYVKRAVSGNASCTNKFFGSDPAPGILKSCEVLLTTSAPPPAPAPAPAPAPTPAPAPAPAPTPPNTYYFSDCQEGAAAGCIPGNDASPGTAVAPKRTLASVNLNALPAGARVLLARGGAWNHPVLRLENPNVTPTQPLVIDAYGQGPLPLLMAPNLTTAAFEFGRWQSTLNDGGYTIRNLKIDGRGSSAWGVWLRDNLRNVTIENTELTGFHIAIHTQSGAPHGVTNLVVRNNLIHRNSAMGMLGQFIDGVIENNTFEANNFSGSTFNHAVYLSGGANGGRNITIRGNRFIRNSVVNGVCQGGNVTFHGQMRNVLIENNRIEQDDSAGGCYGFSVTAGYDTPESFEGFVLRGNTVINLGNCSFCINSAPGIVVENNVSIVSHNRYHAAVHIRPDGGPGDAADTGAVVRNNRACFPNVGPHQYGEVVNSPGGSVSGNVVFSGSNANSKNCPR